MVLFSFVFQFAHGSPGLGDYFELKKQERIVIHLSSVNHDDHTQQLRYPWGVTLSFDIELERSVEEIMQGLAIFDVLILPLPEPAGGSLPRPEAKGNR